MIRKINKIKFFSKKDHDKELISYDLSEESVLDSNDFFEPTDETLFLLVKELDNMRKRIKELEAKVSKYEKIQSTDN